MTRRVLISILAIVLLFVGIVYFIYSLNYNYTLKDIYYDHYTTNETFNVEVTNIRKEKGKEDIIEFKCDTIAKKDKELTNSFFNISASLSQSDFEKSIGKDNNSISSQIYALELTVPAKLKVPFMNTYYTLEIYRYSCFGEKDFTDDEIKEFSSLALDSFTEKNKHSGIVDTSFMMGQIKCTKFSFGSIDSSCNKLKQMLKLEK